MKNRKFENVTSYKTYANAEKAVQRKFGETWIAGEQEINYIIQATEDGRFRPVFIGQSSLQAGTHFHFATTA